jgi:hypothetical protein
LLAVEPDSKTNQLLVSARRTPPVTVVDSLWTPHTQIYPQDDGRLGVLTEDAGFAYDPIREQWTSHSSPLAKINKFYTLTADYISPGGAQRLFNRPLPEHFSYLLSFGNGDGPAQPLLFEESGVSKLPAATENQLLPVRWDWPQNYPMASSQIATDGTNLWILEPRKIYPSSAGLEPVSFADDRQATLFCFTSEFRQPSSMGIRLPVEGVGELPQVNGHAMEFWEPSMVGFALDLGRLLQHVGNMAFWLRTPEGLVFGGPNFCGHWLITDAMLEQQLQAQSASLSPPASAPTRLPAGPKQP